MTTTPYNPELRILHFGRFYNENFGGLERQVMYLLEKLNEQENVAADNLVAADRLRTEILPVKNYTVYKAASFGVLASTAVSPLMPLIARQLLRVRGYQIAHLHFPDPLSALCAYFFPRHVKIVITWHSDVIRQTTLLRFLRPLVDPIIRRADAIVAATPRHFASSTQLGAADPARKHVIPFGLPLEQFEATPAIQAGAARLRAKYAPDDSRPVIFAVGRHIYYKGFEYLIRAMRDVPDAVLLLGGGGPLHESLRQLAGELGLGDRIVFTGRIPDEELVHYYHACDIYCMPSVAPSEAFGLVQVEAMASGKPVVCCELNNGVTYVNRHGETGLVVPPREPAALARALNDLCSSPELRQRLGRQAYERVWSEFTTDIMGSRMLELYRKLAS